MEEWNTLLILLDCAYDLGFGFKLGHRMVRFLLDEITSQICL